MITNTSLLFPVFTEKYVASIEAVAPVAPATWFPLSVKFVASAIAETVKTSPPIDIASPTVISVSNEVPLPTTALVPLVTSTVPVNV